MNNQEQTQSSEVSTAQQKTPETRLKEISQRARQRKSQNAKKSTSNQKSFNPSWLYIGIGGAVVLGVAYLIFREPSKTEAKGQGQSYKFVPISKNEKEPQKAVLETIPEDDESKTNTIPQREADGSKTRFELNSF